MTATAPSPAGTRGRHLLAMLALAGAAAAAAPAAAAAVPVADLRLSQPKAASGLSELVLRATCRPGCTLELRELSAVRFTTKGGVAQLPHAVAGPLRGTHKLAAGKPVEIELKVPTEVQAAAAAVLPKGEALVGNVVVSVQGADGVATDTPRQFVARAPKTRSPYPKTPVVDSIVVREASKAPSGRVVDYAVTIEGTQTSKWSYDRSKTTGGCTIVDSGSGTQKLTYRSKDGYFVQHVPTIGDPVLRSPGKSFEPLIPVRIEADRNSREAKGAAGDCEGGAAGGDGTGGGARTACVRKGGRWVHFLVAYQGPDLYAGATVDSFERATEEPDCPVEVSSAQWDPLDPLTADLQKRAARVLAAGPGKAVFIFKEKRTDAIPGGRLTTTSRYTVTFRRPR